MNTVRYDPSGCLLCISSGSHAAISPPQHGGATPLHRQGENAESNSLRRQQKSLRIPCSIPCSIRQRPSRKNLIVRQNTIKTARQRTAFSQKIPCKFPATREFRC